MIRILLIILIVSCLFSCKKSKLNPYCWGECEEATLFYKGDNCATINGIIVLEDRQSYVFNNRIPKEFRKDSIDVCIKYSHQGDKTLTSDCLMEEVIKIRCIQKNKL